MERAAAARDSFDHWAAHGHYLSALDVAAPSDDASAATQNCCWQRVETAAVTWPALKCRLVRRRLPIGSIQRGCQSSSTKVTFSITL